jgi:ribosomal-protein-alanine N-acetyltransferase
VAGPGDLAALADLHAVAFDETWNRDAIAGAWAAPGGFALIAKVKDRAGDRAVGFALGRVAADECEILTLAVADGAETVFLEVAEDNEAAARLYATAGFNPVGQRPAYYRRRHGPAVAARVLRRNLEPGS